MDVSDIFYFFCSGERKGEFEAPGGGRGDDFLLKIPGRGVSRAGRGGGARGWEGVCGEFGWGGAKYFFFGAEIPTKMITIDTEFKAKRKIIISELITFGITKAKAKVKFGVKYLCNHQCERSSVQLISIRKRKRRTIFGGNSFHFNFRVNGTHIFCYVGINFLIAQDICYTELSGRNSFVCVIWAPLCGTFCKRQLHKRILWELIFQLHTHICYTKELFPNYLCNHFGPHIIPL